MLLATAAEQFGYKMMYPKYLGGALAVTWSDFYKINGYPNRYFYMYIVCIFLGAGCVQCVTIFYRSVKFRYLVYLTAAIDYPIARADPNP